jgi:hypothetical protein
MNIKRGLLRLWVLASALWAVAWLAIAAPEWYRVAQYLHWRLMITQKLHVAEISSLPKSHINEATKRPPTPSGAAKSHLDELIEQLEAASKAAPSDNCDIVGQKCFAVSAPNGSQYVVIADDSFTADSIANYARFYPDTFNRPVQPEISGGGKADPYLVDLTSSKPNGLGPPVTDPTILQQLEPGPSVPWISTVLALAVPLAALGLGFTIGWVVRGFRSGPRTY